MTLIGKNEIIRQIQEYIQDSNSGNIIYIYKKTSLKTELFS